MGGYQGQPAPEEDALRALARKLATGAETQSAASPLGPLPPRRPLEDRLAAFLSGVGPEHAEVTDRLRHDLGHIVSALYDGAPPDPTIFGGSAAMVVVIADGARPISFFENGALRDGAGTGPFMDLLRQNANLLERAAASIGRIESDSRPSPTWSDKWFAGSGFMVADDLVMTNRHVIEHLVNETADIPGPFTLNGDYWINFNGEFGATEHRRFKIKRALFAGDRAIGRDLDIAKLDLALLRIGDSEGAGDPPPPLPLSATPPQLGEPVFLTGYPGLPRIASGQTPDSDSEIEEVLIRLFDGRYGGKRCASGEIDALAGSFPEDTGQWTLKHDASTLSGSSGSPMIRILGGAADVVGLHFGGVSRVTNYGHAVERLAAQLSPYGVELV